MSIALVAGACSGSGSGSLVVSEGEEMSRTIERGEPEGDASAVGSAEVDACGAAKTTEDPAGEGGGNVSAADIIRVSQMNERLGGYR